MVSLTFSLVEDQERDTIVHCDAGLQVSVFNLDIEPFYPSGNQHHVFGDDHGEWIAFETNGWNGQTTHLLMQAAAWYARYLDFPEMVVTIEDPRPAFTLRKLL
jgi:hypothetical protein